MSQRSLMFSCLLLVLSAVRADAAIMVSVQNATITANGSGFVDVLISSTPDVQLGLTNFEFEITDPLNGTGSLEFIPSTDFSPPNYVFGAATGNYFQSVTNSGVNITGGDIFGSGETNVPLTAASMTLVRLNVQHSTSTPLAAVGSTFHVRLVNSLLTDFLSVDNNGTLGDNSDDTLTSLSIAPLSFTNLGTVTISAAAVPEPGTIGVMAILGQGRSFAAESYLSVAMHNDSRLIDHVR